MFCLTTATLALPDVCVVLHKHLSGDALCIQAVAGYLEAMMDALEALLHGQNELYDGVRLFNRAIGIDSA